MSQYDMVNRVLVSLREAMLDDAHWPTTSGLIDDACGIKGSALVVGSGHSQADGQILFGRFCEHGQRYEDRERSYFRDYFPHDERVPRLVQLPDSRLTHIPDLYTARELKISPTYNELLLPTNCQNGLNVRMDGPNGSHIIWTLTDSTEPDGWGSSQTETIEYLLPHIRQFVRVRQALADAEALGASLTGLLDNTRIAVIHLDRRGRITAANDRARNFMRQADGLFDRDGFLAARLPADDTRLKRLLARALPTSGGQAVSGSMTVRRSPGLPRLAVHVNPVEFRQIELDARRVAALAWVLDPEFRPHIDPGLVAATLGLTPVESRVAVLLAEGKSVRDIAAATGRQEHSVRFHIKQIHRKQGTSRRADLVRLVLSLVDFSHSRP